MPWPDTPITDLFDIAYPIVQAPMAGASSPAMAAAVAAAGGLGSLGCAGMSADTVQAEIAAAHRGTNRPVNVNFFTHSPPQENPALTKAAMDRLAPWYERLGAGQPKPPADNMFPFDTAMCDALVAAGARVVSFHFGLPAPELVARVKDAGMIVLSSATSVAEARWLEERGADVIVAQGVEAGGHNGWFLPRNGADVATTMALVPRVVDAVSVPVLAAGGIADGRGIAAALMLGASGVQIGTAFLATPECRTAEAHKRAVAAASGDDTLATRAYSGRSARGLVNAYSAEMAQYDDWPEFPLMNAATGPLRAASAAAGHGDAFALWAGQAAGLARAETTTEVMGRLISETDAVLSCASGMRL